MKSLLIKIISRMPNWLFRYNQAVVFFTDSPLIKTRNNDNYEFGIATENDIDRVIGLSGHERSALIERFQNNCQCFFVAEKATNEIVAVQWALIGKCFVRGLNLPININSNEVYLFGGLSSPKVRFTGIYNNLLKLVCDHHKSINIKTFCGIVETNNTFSQKYHRKINFTPSILTTYIKFLNMRLSYDKDISESGKNKSKLRVLLKEPTDIFVV